MLQRVLSASHSQSDSVPAARCRLEVGDGDFGFGAFGADEAEGEDVDGGAAVVEEAFVAVADLLDVEGLVADPLGDPAAAGLDLDGEEGVEDGEDGAVVDGNRPSGADDGVVGGAEVDAADDHVVGRSAAFEEREPVGVEEAAAVGGEGEAVVVGAAVDSPEGGEQAVPCGRAAFEGVLAVAGASGVRRSSRRVSTE